MLSFLRSIPVGQRIPNGAVVILTSELQFKTSTKLDSDQHDRSSDRSEHSSSNSRRPSQPAYPPLDSTEDTSPTTVVPEEIKRKKKQFDRKRRPLSRPTFVFSFLLIAVLSSIVPFVRAVNVSSETTDSEGGYGETTANIAREYVIVCLSSAADPLRDRTTIDPV